MSGLNGAARHDKRDDARSALLMQSMPGHLVRRLQQVAVRLFAEELGNGLTPVQFAALCAIADQPKLAQSALAALIGYDRATIGSVIDRLEHKGWVTRIASPDDRRAYALAITPKGRHVIANAKGRVEDIQQRLLEPLTEAEKKGFEAACLKLLAYHKG